jgi:hypothetical protein
VGKIMTISYQAFKKTIYEKEYPQNDLLTAPKFIRYLQDRGLQYNYEDLKICDKKKIFSPLYRIKKSSIGKRLDGYYYHPYQVFILYEFQYPLMYYKLRINFLDWKKEYKNTLAENIDKYFVNQISFCKKHLSSRLEKLYLLLLIEDRYLPSIRGFLHFSDSNITKSQIDWEEWTKDFNPNDILKKSKFNITDLRNARKYFIMKGQSCDDIKNIKLLIDLIPFRKRNDMKGNSRLAQEYYEMAELIKFFIEDITGKKETSPFDLLDKNGQRIDLYNRDIRHKVLEEFLINPNYKVYLVIEGDTEEMVINYIEKAYGMSLESFDIKLYNLKGLGNINRVEGLIKENNDNNIISYFILDNEGEWKKEYEKWEQRNWVDRKYSHIWRRNFEEDNFREKDLIKIINKLLKKNNLKKVITNDLFNQYKKENEMKKTPKPLKTLLKDIIQQEFNYPLKIKDYAKELGIMVREDIIYRADDKPKFEIEKKIIELIRLSRSHHF